MMITLLNNESWHEVDLIDRMYDDDFYYNYLGTDKCLSSSSVKDLYKNPDKFFNSPSRGALNTKAIRDGKLIHTLVLEADKLHDKYEFVDVKSRNTKSFEEVNSSTDKDVMLSDELVDSEMVADMINSNPHAIKYLKNGEAEVPGIGNVFGIPFRAKADYLFPNMIVDLKTTSNLDDWIRAAKHTWHYDMQAFIYCSIFGIDNFTFVVIDKNTYKIGIFPLSAKTKKFGGNKLEMAVFNYKTYLNKEIEQLDEFTIRGEL